MSKSVSHDLLESIFSRCSRTESGCLVWNGYRGRRGYGRVTIKGKVYRVHRIVYHNIKGPIPEGHGVLHACDNPPCCEPTHLFTGTTQDNTRDKMSKGRQARGAGVVANRRSYAGEGHPSHKLTKVQVRSILSDPRGYRTVSIDYGVSKSLIAAIRKGRLWQKALTASS